MDLRNHAKFNGYEARNLKLHVLGADPSLGASDGGRVWWRSDTGRFRGWDGSAMHTLTNLIETISNDGTITSSQTGKDVALGIVPASQTVRGTMSATDKSKLDAATAAATPSALVQRDASGNFAAGTITAALNGLAADSTLHGGKTLAEVRDFNQTTGQRTALSAISDFNTAVRANTLDQMAPPTNTVSANNQRVANAADPVNPQDLATRNYVDSVASGLDPKGSVRMGTTAALAATYANGTAGVGATLTATANGVLGNFDTSVAPALNDRILVKNQPTQGHNGLYRVTSLGSASTPWVLTRTADADQAAEVTPGMFTFIEEGTTLAKTGWVLSSTGVTTIGSTNLPFTQFSGAGTYIQGNGIAITGQSIAAVGTAGRITVGTAIDIASTYVGQASITTLGTIGTGIWQGTPVGLAYGGTGASTPLAARQNLLALTGRAGDLPAGQSPVWNHGMGTTDVIGIQVVEKATGAIVIVDPVIVDGNNIRFDFGDTVAAGAYRAMGAGIATAGS